MLLSGEGGGLQMHECRRLRCGGRAWAGDCPPHCCRRSHHAPDALRRTLLSAAVAPGTYYASAYFMAKVVAEQVFQLPIPLIFSAIVYFLVGLQPAASKFFVFATFMLLTNWAATSLALMVSTWCVAPPARRSFACARALLCAAARLCTPDLQPSLAPLLASPPPPPTPRRCRGVDLAISVLPMALEICRLYGGFFLSPANLPTYFVWLDALSYVKVRAARRAATHTRLGVRCRAAAMQLSQDWVPQR